MITNEGAHICDKEIRSRSGLWCGCRKPAKFRVVSKVVPHMELDYCARHAPREPHSIKTLSSFTLNKWRE